MDAIVDPAELENRLSSAVSGIQGGKAVGYARLWKEYAVRAPLRSAEAIAGGRLSRNEREVEGVLWRSARSWPGDTLFDHLEYAVRRERLDLLLLKRLFLSLESGDVRDLAEAIRTRPSSVNARRVWFLYEWLTRREMDVPDLKVGNYDLVLDPATYYAHGAPTMNRRHRLHDNMPGTPEFCAITRRTDFLDLATGYQSRIRRVVDDVDPDLRRRAAAHMVLKDSKASFEIEGEIEPGRPANERVRRWGKVIGRAGSRPLDMDYLSHLQEEVIGNSPFVRLGFRAEGVFLGDRDREGGPIPEFIGARAEDVPSLVDGILRFNSKALEDDAFNPVAHAASVAFSFVYVHPFEDGNGRIHRYLIEHVLAERNVSPSGMVFPVAPAILKRIEDYARVLKQHSLPLMEFIPWRASGNGNVEVVEDTSDLYRFPDVTEQASFLAECMEQTIDHDMPDEIGYLKAFDQAVKAIDSIAPMPNSKATLLISLINQNGGSLSKKKRKAEFPELEDRLLQQIEDAVRDSFAVVQTADTAIAENMSV